MKMFIFFFYPLSCKAMFLLYRKLNFDSYPLVVGLVAIKAVNVKSFFNFSGCASRFCEIEKKIQKCFFFHFRCACVVSPVIAKFHFASASIRFCAIVLFF